MFHGNSPWFFFPTTNSRHHATQEEEDKEAVGTVEKSKNWSSVNLAFQERCPMRCRMGLGLGWADRADRADGR